MKGEILMTNEQNQLLTDLYECYQNGKRGNHIDLTGITSIEKQSILVQIKYLEDKDLICVEAQSAGFIELSLTSDGIDFIENGFSAPGSTPIIQGNHNIVVNGSNNTVSDNYNNAVEISNSDLPEETKLLIENFLYEIKNPKLNQEKKSEKINQFLFELTSGTLSGLATNGLSFLISSIFNQF
jgi:hypothetical protein